LYAGGRHSRAVHLVPALDKPSDRTRRATQRRQRCFRRRRRDEPRSSRSNASPWNALNDEWITEHAVPRHQGAHVDILACRPYPISINAACWKSTRTLGCGGGGGRQQAAPDQCQRHPRHPGACSWRIFFTGPGPCCSRSGWNRIMRTPQQRCRDSLLHFSKLLQFTNIRQSDKRGSLVMSCGEARYVVCRDCGFELSGNGDAGMWINAGF
jgi:hypothetical protein